MPYWSTQKSMSVTVYRATVSLTVSPSPPWRAGQSVTFKARVLSDGTPLEGVPVVFQILDPYGNPADFEGVKYTDSDGYATLTRTIPWTFMIRSVNYTLPCSTWNFMASAVIDSAVVRSNKVSAAIAYPTGITISAPSKIPVGAEFEVKGKLTYEAAPNEWRGLGGKKVTIYANDTKIGEAETDGEGNYSVKVKISTPGTYTLKAVYPGEGLTAGTAALARTTVGLMRPPMSPLPQMIAGGLMLLAGIL